MTTLQTVETRWFCENCMDTTIHTRLVERTTKRRTFECTRCHEQFQRPQHPTLWRKTKVKRKYRYIMLCTHCGYKWHSKALKRPKDCHKCGSKHIIVVGVTSEWREQRT